MRRVRPRSRPPARRLMASPSSHGRHAEAPWGLVRVPAVKIAVCVKQVPEGAARRLDPATKRLDRSGEGALNPFDAHAVEEALQIRDAAGEGEVVVLSMGPQKALDSLRKALAMGADRAVLVSDDALAGSDLVATSGVLAKALEREQADLVLLGQQGSDSDGAVLGAALADRLRLPMFSQAAELTVEGGSIRGKRQTEFGYDVIEAPLPAVVAVSDAINEPRYPSLKGIMGAKKKPQETLSLADLEVESGAAGEEGSKTEVSALGDPPPRGDSRKIEDDGTAAQQIVRDRGFDTVLFAGSVLAADTAAGLAARLDAGLNWDLTDLASEDGRLVGKRPALEDSVYVDVGWRGEPRLALFRSGAFDPSETGGDAEVEEVSVSFEDFSQAAKMLEQAHEERSGPSIEDAEVIVAGGRGLGGPENFKLCEEPAEALGGAVAATRAVVDAGWYPYAAQVGQTGRSVSPKLYVACGISGAIQHKVGMQSSNVVVAINKDPNAPIFEFSDLGVVGDLHEIVPKLTELVRARKGS